MINTIGEDGIYKDGHLYLCGQVDSSNNYGINPQMYLMKCDTNGNIIWFKGYGGISYDACTTMDTCADGGFILGGWTTSFGGPDQEPYIVKVDSNGNYQWHKWYDFGHNNNQDDWPAVVVSLKDGGIVAVTSEVQVYTPTNLFSKIFFTKYDLNGNLLWRKSIGDTLVNAAVYSAKLDADGNIIASAVARRYNYIIKISPDGDSLLFKREYYLGKDICKYNDIYAFDIEPLPGGNYALGGFIIPLNGQGPNNNQDAWLATFDSSGCQLPYAPYNVTASVSYTASDTIVTLSWNYNDNNPNHVFVVEKYIPEYYTWAFISTECINYTPIGSYLNTTTYVDTISKMYAFPEYNTARNPVYRVFALDTAQHLTSCFSNTLTVDITVGISQTQTSATAVRVFPNPASDQITVEYTISKNVSLNFVLYDLLGKEILRKQLPAGQGLQTIKLPEVNAGNYLYTITRDGEVFTQDKLVIIK